MTEVRQQRPSLEPRHLDAAYQALKKARGFLDGEIHTLAQAIADAEAECADKLEKAEAILRVLATEGCDNPDTDDAQECGGACLPCSARALLGDRRDDPEYYILDSRSVVGNCALWWCEDGKGYTCNLDEAGLYTLKEALSKRESDVPVHKDIAKSCAVKHVRWDHLPQRGVHFKTDLPEYRRSLMAKLDRLTRPEEHGQ